MSMPLLFPANQRKADEDQLNLLSIFHFIGAGFAGIGLCFLFAHYLIVHLVFLSAAAHPGPQKIPPPVVFEFLRWGYAVFALWLVANLALNVAAGIGLRKRRHRTFCIVVASINCIHIPIGTLLGVFTLVVLLRDSVREMFDLSQPGSPFVTT